MVPSEWRIKVETVLVVRIGKFLLDPPLLLSPLAGYTDLAFRCSLRRVGGVGLTFTEFVNPRGWKEGSLRSLQIVATCPEDSPNSVQIYGTDAGELAEAAVRAAELGSPTVDINMGCPVPKVAGKGGGSGLLRCCPDAVRLAAAVVRACPVPVTVKTRLGWEIGDLVTPTLAQALEDVGVAALTIHGRYGMQKFKGTVDLAGIRAVVAAVRSIPVFGNGDIQSPADVLRMMNETGCAGVMIGRRALTDQWLFRETAAILSGQPLPAPPTRWERTQAMVDCFHEVCRRFDERKAVLDFRKRCSWFFKAIGPCPTLRRSLPMLESVTQFEDLVGNFKDQLVATGAANERPLLYLRGAAALHWPGALRPVPSEEQWAEWYRLAPGVAEQPGLRCGIPFATSVGEIESKELVAHGFS